MSAGPVLVLIPVSTPTIYISLLQQQIRTLPRMPISDFRYFDDNLPEDNVPYADFDAPIDSNNPRDSSATAIVASALLELFQLTGGYFPAPILRSEICTLCPPPLPKTISHRLVSVSSPFYLPPLLSLSSYLAGNPSYLEMAQEYMSSLLLSPEYFDPTATDGWEALLRKSAADWGGPEVGSITGDYYTLEMMASVQDDL